MRYYLEILLTATLLGILIAMDQFLGRRVMLFASGLAATWFCISIVLSTRPPGIPEIVSEDVGEDEQHVIRKDLIPQVPAGQRLRLSLSVACGACLILWLTLTLLAN